MKVFAVACLLLGVVAAAHAAEPLFTEYLAAQKAGAASVKPAYYEEAERATVCFRNKNYCQRYGCTPGTPGDTDCNDYNEIDSLVCAECGSSYGYKSHYGDSDTFDRQLNAAVEAGHCMFYRHETTPVKLAGTTGVNYRGNFYATCTIKTEAGQCSLPESCNDITVNIQGVVYLVDNAVRVGPAQALVDTCGTGVRKIGNKAASGDAKKATTQNIIEIDAPPSTVYAGPAYIYTGHAKVYTHGMVAPKFSNAHFQYSIFYPDPTSQSAAGLETLPRLGDDLYRFDFFNQKPAYA